MRAAGGGGRGAGEEVRGYHCGVCVCVCVFRRKWLRKTSGGEAGEVKGRSGVVIFRGDRCGLQK